MTPFPSKKYVEMPEIVYGLNLGEWSESVFGVENMERGYRTTQTLQCNSCKNKTKVQYSCYCKAITTVREPNFLSSFLAWYHHAFIFSYSTTTCCWSGFSRHLPRPPNPSRGNRPNPSFGSTAWCSARPRKRINKSCKKGWRNKKKLRNCIARRFYHVTCKTRFYDWSSMNRTSDWPWWAVLLVNKNWSQQAQNLGFIWIMPNDETNPEIFACSAHVLNGPKPVELSWFLGSCQIGSPFFRRHVLDVWNIFEGNLGSPKIKPIGTPFRLPTLQRSLPHGLPNKPPSLEMLGSSDWLTYRNTDRRYPVPSVFLCKKGILSIFPLVEDFFWQQYTKGASSSSSWQVPVTVQYLGRTTYSSAERKPWLPVIHHKIKNIIHASTTQLAGRPHFSGPKSWEMLKRQIFLDLGVHEAPFLSKVPRPHHSHHLTISHQSRPQVCGSEASGKRGRSERSAFSYAACWWLDLVIGMRIWCAWYITEWLGESWIFRKWEFQ